MSRRESNNAGGLRPQYQTYKRQKCFIAYSKQAEWSDDLLSACQEILCRPEFDLQPDYMEKHFDPDIPLRQKALELIANARYGIYDMSYWRNEKGEWQMPRNVFIELGMAIALNRPTLLLRHANNRGLELPKCLKGLGGHILEFSGETTLKRTLEERLPQWVNAPPERDWWKPYCIFGGRTCEYRETHPRAKQWEERALRCHISDGHDVDRGDFRDVVEEVLGRFSDVTSVYLDQLPVTKGYDFLLCTHCQNVRSTPFAIYRITPHTQPETFIAIGISIALETQFEYKIPKILLTENVKDVPSLLSGYEVVVARSDKERRDRLRRFIPAVMEKVRETAWKPRPLPFVEILIPSIETAERLNEEQKISDLEKTRPKILEHLDRSVDELEISVRASHCLEVASITTIGELVQKTEAELLKIKNFGYKTLKEIKEVLFEIGLSLGMDLSGLDSIEQGTGLREVKKLIDLGKEKG